MCRGSTVIEGLGAFLNTRMRTAQPDLEDTCVALVVSHVFIISKRQLGIKLLSQSDSLRGPMETEGNMIDVSKR